MSNAPTVRKTTILAEVTRQDPDFYKEQWSYRFSGGRTFMSSQAIDPDEAVFDDFHFVGGGMAFSDSLED